MFAGRSLFKVTRDLRAQANKTIRFSNLHISNQEVVFLIQLNMNFSNPFNLLWVEGQAQTRESLGNVINHALRFTQGARHKIDIVKNNIYISSIS